MIHKISLPLAGAVLLFLVAVVFAFYSFAAFQKEGEIPSLFGIPLIRPSLAQSGSPGLPDSQAGLSSYVQRDPSLIDFATISPIFDETIQNGDNYIIGAFNISRTEIGGTPAPISIHVRVYVDKDGFIIAYLTKDKLAADMFRWHLLDPIINPLDTVLSDALVAVTTTVGAPAPTDASWYHWNYPSATHFSAAARKGVGNMYMTIPAGAIFSENPSYSWYSRQETQQQVDNSGGVFLFLPDGTRTT